MPGINPVRPRLRALHDQTAMLVSLLFQDTWATPLSEITASICVTGLALTTHLSPSLRGSPCPDSSGRRPPPPHLGLEGHSVLGGLCLRLGLLP